MHNRWIENCDLPELCDKHSVEATSQSLEVDAFELLQKFYIEGFDATAASSAFLYFSDPNAVQYHCYHHGPH